jgi:sulfide:quinone oxidoreductase
VGLGFHHIPVRGMPIPADDVAQHRRIINESTGPVLAYCRSGQRSVAIFQAGT